MPEVAAVGITGIGSYVPDKVLTNYDLEKMVETSDEWIRERTGIRERRIVHPDQATSDLAVIAAEHALKDAGIDASEVDLIIVATATPDMLFPSTACLVQNRIGADHAGAFDLQAGCSGFVYALSVGSQFVATGKYKRVLVIGAETLSRITNWDDRTTCVLFGDGAGAVVLERVTRGRGILASCLGADGAGADILCLPAGGSRLPASEQTVAAKQHYLSMNGREVFKFAVRVTEEATRQVLQQAGLTVEDVDHLILHQANIRIMEAAAKRLGIGSDRLVVNVDRYGNTSSASIPLALSEAVVDGRIKDGDCVVMVAFGAGLTWAASAIKWGHG
ncbi:MAG: ketoacyl-ACP synthase III [Peptococcaceae bacterium]|nr:ketoacyl-ACP synthase III [Peptococcaceae bacterium]